MHYDGDPNGCSEDCQGPHLDDLPAGAPEVCADCGGNAKRCYPVCRERQTNRPFEPWEGLTADQVHAEVY